mmetsp:Transcript_17110/g.32588  ORF Transcript_17110/g.32588 Transcript_17110/m.32588 type:complete len:595 (-) Transcript_17110:58-1842(-)
MTLPTFTSSAFPRWTFSHTSIQGNTWTCQRGRRRLRFFSVHSYDGTTTSRKETPLDSIAPLVNQAHQTFATQMTQPYDYRIQQLKGIENLVQENWDELSSAIANDLGQGPMYAEAFELSSVVSRARYSQSNLRKWMETKRVPTPFPLNLNMPIHSELAPNPRGVALIIVPWNLPIQLTLNPLIDALAAGNVCILKPSEKCDNTTSLLTDLLTGGKYLDPRAVQVVNGGAEQAIELLKHRVDVISYTGGGEVGRIVAQAAAKHLTPVLLELGGKNPTIVTKNAHIPSAALRIAWGKITGNAGQLCVSPDYILVEESVKQQFTNELFKALDKLYPLSTYSMPSLEESGQTMYGDVGKMISVEYAQRVTDLIDSTCQIIYGGKTHKVDDRFVAPTVVEANADSNIMKSEIFGPVLAVVTVPNVQGAIDFVNTHYSSKGEHPLAMYIFSKSKEEQNQIMTSIPSGMCAINDVLKQSANYHLPFGGIGASGMNTYYGKFGFDFYSHYRGTLVENNFSTQKFDPTVWLTFPPYDGMKLFAYRCISKFPLILDNIKKVLPFVKVAIPFCAAMYLANHPAMVDMILDLNIKKILKWISLAWR